MTRLVGLLVLAGTTAAAPVPKKLNRPDDAAAVVGRWETVVADYSQKPGAVGAVFRFAADGTGGVRPPPGTGDELSASYVIRPAAEPKRFEWNLGGGGSNTVATYELAGDTLKLAFGEGGAQPANAAPGPNVSYYELKRVKEGR